MRLTVDSVEYSNVSDATLISTFFKDNYTLTWNRIDLTPFANSYVTILDDGAQLKNEWTNQPMNPGVVLKFPSAPEANLVSANNWTVFEEYEGEGIFGPEEKNAEVSCFGSAAAIGISAWGPQEEIMYDFSEKWIQPLKKHTNFTTKQRIQPLSGQFLGSSMLIKINPREYGDLAGNFVFQCSLPSNINKPNRVGWYLIKKAELFIDGQLVDSYDDNWAFISEQLFSSADEQSANDSLLNGYNLYIPLLFFCRKGTWFPFTCLFNQMVYIRLTFNTQSWFTDYSTSFDLTGTNLIFDTVYLTHKERTVMKNTRRDIFIPKVVQETPVLFSSNFANLNMSANFDISMIVWFIQNTKYTQYYNRYTFGYTNALAQSYTTWVDWRGVTQKYIPTLNDASIYINNQNIIQKFVGNLYFNFTQPLHHGLNIPSMDMYVYCFADEPKKIGSIGTLDFRTFASKTTNLQLNFNQSLAAQLVSSYNLILYYYGYTTLRFENGSGTVLDL